MAAISAAELDATWRQLERVPRPDLARALARAQELGAAAFKGHVAVVTLLLADARVDPNIATKKGNTSLL